MTKSAVLIAFVSLSATSCERRDGGLGPELLTVAELPNGVCVSSKNLPKGWRIFTQTEPRYSPYPSAVTLLPPGPDHRFKLPRGHLYFNEHTSIIAPRPRAKPHVLENGVVLQPPLSIEEHVHEALTANPQKFKDETLTTDTLFAVMSDEGDRYFRAKRDGREFSCSISETFVRPGCWAIAPLQRTGYRAMVNFPFELREDYRRQIDTRVAVAEGAFVPCR